MPINSNIALGVKPIEIESPVNQLARVMQIQGLQGQNRLHELQMMQAQQGMDDTNRLNQLYRGALGADGKIDRAALIRGAAEQGMGKHIPGLQKGFADADKSQSDLSKSQIEVATKKLELAGQAFGHVRSNPTLENANFALDYLGQNGVYTPEEVAIHKAAVAKNPGDIARLADIAFRTVLNTKDQLSKYETRNTGGTTDTISIDPVTGKVATVNSVRNTQSPDSMASTAVTKRGQDMADSRAREKNQIDKDAIGKVEWKQDTDGNWVGLPKDVKGGGAVTPVTTTVPGKRATQAGHAIDIIAEARGLIDSGTSSYIGAGVDQAARLVGVGTKGAQNAAKLKALEGALMMAQPRMEGPQSDKDVALYRQMAGQIGDSTVPAANKKAALDAIEALHNKYTGGGKPTATNIDALLNKYK